MAEPSVLDALFPTETAVAETPAVDAPATPVAVEPAAEAAAPVAVVPAEPKLSPLAEKIKADREARQARSQVQQVNNEYKSKYEEALAQIEALKAQGDPMQDPVGWAKSRNMSRDEQALFAQSLIYDIVPEEADASMRIKLFEAKQAREKRLEKETHAQEQARLAQEQRAQMINDYAEDVESAVASFTEGSFPECEAYFGDDHETYMGTLMAKARSMADAANRAGQRVDLSPGTVARALEAELVARLTARDNRRAAKPSTKQPTRVDVPGQPIGSETESLRGMTGSSAPRPVAQTEQERRQRAIEAAFGGR